MNLRKLHRYRVNYARIKSNWVEICVTNGGYPITINGYVFFVGYVREENYCSGWRVTDRITGTYVGKIGLSSFDAAVAMIVKAFKKNEGDRFCEVVAKLLKEKTILKHPKMLVQRYSDYTPILEFTVCEEDENE